MKASEWIEQIVRTHHAYLRSELPALSSLIDVFYKRAPEEPERGRLRKTFQDLKAELQTHILKEESMLFPSIRHLEECADRRERPDLRRHDIRESLEQAEYEHDATEEFLAELSRTMREIGYSEEYGSLFHRIEILARDLGEHIQKEETNLFPEARLLYSKATKGMLREE